MLNEKVEDFVKQLAESSKPRPEAEIGWAGALKR